jgi:hypothetical protein
MSTDSDAALIGRITRECQIIIGTMMTGVVFFLGFMTAIRATPPPQPAATPGGGAGASGPAAPQQGIDAGRLWTWLAVGVAALDLPLSVILPNLMTGQNRRAMAQGKSTAPQTSLDGTELIESDTGKLAMAYQSQLTLGAALNEGAAFLACIAYRMGRDPITLGVAILLLGAIAVRFPTTHRVSLWIAREEEMLSLERQAFA